MDRVQQIRALLAGENIPVKIKKAGSEWHNGLFLERGKYLPEYKFIWRDNGNIGTATVLESDRQFQIKQNTKTGLLHVIYQIAYNEFILRPDDPDFSALNDLLNNYDITSYSLSCI